MLAIVLDSDLVALKSSDDMINDPTIRATVMASRYREEGLPIALIMSKAGSPFLKNWRGQYKAVKVIENWEELSIKTPYFMLQDRNPDQPVLDGHSWFYKLSTKQNGEATIRMHWV